MMLKLQGLLQIRGEIKKSDTVAALLATKAVQSMVAETRFLLMDRLDVEVQMLEDFKIILNHGRSWNSCFCLSHVVLTEPGAWK